MAYGNASRIRSWAQVTRVSAIAVCVLGGLGFVGWVLGFERLTAFQAGRIPMAPSTAVLFLLFGVLMFRDAEAEDLTPARFWSRLAASVVGIGVALVLLVLSSLRITPGVEHLWLEPSGEVSGAPIGHMSPVTALGFIMAGSAYFILALTREYRRPRAAFTLGIVLELLGLTLTTAYLLSRPLLYDTGFIPPALSTSLAFMALGGAVLGAAARRVWAGHHADELQPKPVYPVLAILAVITTLAVTPAYLMFRDYAAGVRTQVEAQLLSIADLKAGQMEAWREERLSDAATFHQNAVFAELVEAALYQGDREAVEQIRSWLEPVLEAYGYEQIGVMDSTGRTRITVPDTGPASSDAEHHAAAALRVMRAGDVTMEGFHRDAPDGSVHLTTLAPLLGPAGVVLGAVALSADPASDLYPALTQWPTANRTAETLLVRQDGDEILFLNDLRFRDDATLGLRIPASDPELLAARAVRGTRGVIEGRDYRGEPAIGAVRYISDTGWWLVARMDTEEAFGPLRSRLAWTVALVIFLVLTVIGLLGFGWQRREKLHYRELARSEEQYRTLFEGAPVGIFRTRSDGQALALNWNMARILGFESPDQAVEHYHDLAAQLYVRPEQRAEALRQLRENGFLENYQYEARRLDGTVIWMAMNARVADENPDGTFDIEGFAWDITDQKEAEQTRRQQQAMLERTERIAGIGSWEWDADTDTVTWSGEMFRIFRRDPDIGAPSLREHAGFLPPSDMDRLQTAVEHAVGEGQPYDIELQVQGPGEPVRHVQARGFPEVDPDGQVRRLYGLVEDVTERKHRQEREAELGAQLNQAQKMESVGRLAGGVAHDFNNLLTAVKGHASILLDDIPADSPFREDVGQILMAGERAADLTRQLLAFSRRQVFEERNVDLSSVAVELEKLLGRLVPERIRFRVVGSGEPAVVYADAGQIHQVLMNLVVNAVDAIEEDGSITVEVEPVELDESDIRKIPWDVEPGPYVRLSVQDTGSGMPTEVLKHLFEPFFTTKEDGHGTGLGLATVYGIVKQSGGHILVESEPGRGSTFRVLLPRVSGEVDQVREQPAMVSPVEGGVVLLVEDDEAVRTIARRVLVRAGYTVVEAANGREALDLAEDGIDVVISDVVMPDMGGVELHKRLGEQYPKLKVILTSGYSEAEVKGEIRQLGAAFLPKPFTPQSLIRCVTEVLAESSQGS